MSLHITEAELEALVLEWLQALGWQVLKGSELSDRQDYREVILSQRLQNALYRLNPDLPTDSLSDALRKLTHPQGADLLQQNRSFHRLLVDGVPVEYRTPTGEIRGAQVQVIDFTNPDNNEWLAVNQFPVVGSKQTRRADVVLFVNGLPLAVIELKNPTDEDATIWKAWQQLQTYQAEIPNLFVPNEVLVISDGLEARIGAIGAGREWFKPWRTITGETLAPTTLPQLQVLTQGVFDKSLFLELVKHFIVFEDDGSRLVKKLAGYHQFHAVRVAVAETLRAIAPAQTHKLAEPQGTYTAGAQVRGTPGDRRIGVIWHTQGSGKSLTMTFYAGRIIQEPAMQNPTLVILTDRNDLDDQLFNTFARCQELLRQAPVQATSRSHLRQLLSVPSGGVVFTTIQKFLPEQKGDKHPLLSDRANIVVIADEAHRSQYDFIDGFARHLRDALPNASFIGFTGTPIEKTDANTRAVFGDYISIYDIQQAVTDGATVPIYYESRLAKLDLPPELKPQIDAEFEEVTEGEETERKEQLKNKWAQLEAIVGTEKRLQMIAADIVQHYEQRQAALQGKAMIVCMSRRICVELYHHLVQLRPHWHNDADDRGQIKVVMTGSASDPTDWQPHIRDKRRRELLADRFRNPDDPLQIVIVRDMWLTGFDCPCLHTLYIDKPMRGHNLMQAIARVNRVFRDKPGGLVVDYIGIAQELKSALATYSESGGRGHTAIDLEEAIRVLQEKYEVCMGLWHGFDWSSWQTGTAQDRLALLPAAQEHILSQPQGKERFTKAVQELSRAFALSVPHPYALSIQDAVAFCQAVQSALNKRAPNETQAPAELDRAIRQIIAQAVAPEGVLDIFATAGLAKPDISILSDEFLAEVRGMPHKNLAVELLQKLLKGEIRNLTRKRLVQARSFAEMLDQVLRRYHNRAIEAAQVIEELIALAKDLRTASAKGEELGLTEEELAFYDALETNDSAVKILGDATLKAIARELVQTVRANVTIDWTVRENVRANLRRLVKRILRKYNYPPDKQEKAIQTVIEQAELLSGEWATEGIG